MNHQPYIFWAFFLTGLILIMLGLVSVFDDIKQTRRLKKLQE